VNFLGKTQVARTEEAIEEKEVKASVREGEMKKDEKVVSRGLTGMKERGCLFLALTHKSTKTQAVAPSC